MGKVRAALKINTGQLEDMLRLDRDITINNVSFDPSDMSIMIFMESVNDFPGFEQLKPFDHQVIIPLKSVQLKRSIFQCISDLKSIVNDFESMNALVFEKGEIDNHAS